MPPSSIARRPQRALVFLLMAAGVLGGCVQLKAVRVGSAPEVPTEGVPYNLTFTQYVVSATHRVRACQKDGKPELDLVTAVSATRKEVRDPKRDYIIDFAALRNVFKTTDIAVEYHENGALKSVNASVEDKTAQVLTGVFQAVGKLAVAGAALAVKPTCKPATVQAVQAVTVGEAKLQQAQRALTGATQRVEHLTLVGATLGRGWDAAGRQELVTAINALYSAKGAVETAEAELTAALEKVTIKGNAVWPPHGELFDSDQPIIPPLTLVQVQAWGAGASGSLQKLADTTAVYPRLRAATSIGRAQPCDDEKCSDDRVTGLKYRMPAPGRLMLCSTAACDPKADVVHGYEEGLVSQLGPVLALPLRNYPFMQQSVEAVFNNAGQPLKLGYKSEGGSEKLTDVLGTVVDEAIKVRAARKPKTELDLVKEETELLVAKTELAVAKKKLAPAANEQQAAATDTLKADTALLEAELAKLRAEVALNTARAELAKQ